MKIRSNVLTANDLYRVANEVQPKGWFDRFRKFKPRNHTYGYDVIWITEYDDQHKRRPNSGKTGAGDAYALTYNEWGYFLARLFAIDPDMQTDYYDNVSDFLSKTEYEHDRIKQWRPDLIAKGKGASFFEEYSKARSLAGNPVAGVV